MTKSFGPWIKFSGTICPVNPDDLVRVQLGGTLNLGEQPAHKLNWDAGVITAYRVLGGKGKPKTQEEKFLQLMMDDSYKKDPFKSKGINVSTLNYDQIVQSNNNIFKEFILYSYNRLESLPSLDPSYIENELMEIKKWLKIEEIWSNLLTSYNKLNILIKLDSLPFSEKSAKFLIDDLNDAVLNTNNQEVIYYISSIDKTYKEYFSYKT
jgi:hypothetical protein